MSSLLSCWSINTLWPRLEAILSAGTFLWKSLELRGVIAQSKCFEETIVGLEMDSHCAQLYTFWPSRRVQVTARLGLPYTHLCFLYFFHSKPERNSILWKPIYLSVTSAWQFQGLREQHSVEAAIQGSSAKRKAINWLGSKGRWSALGSWEAMALHITQTDMPSFHGRKMNCF